MTKATAPASAPSTPPGRRRWPRSWPPLPSLRGRAAGCLDRWPPLPRRGRRATPDRRRSRPGPALRGRLGPAPAWRRWRRRCGRWAGSWGLPHMGWGSGNGGIGWGAGGAGSGRGPGPGVGPGTGSIGGAGSGLEIRGRTVRAYPRSRGPKRRTAPGTAPILDGYVPLRVHIRPRSGRPRRHRRRRRRTARARRRPLMRRRSRPERRLTGPAAGTRLGGWGTPAGLLVGDGPTSGRWPLSMAWQQTAPLLIAALRKEGVRPFGEA